MSFLISGRRETDLNSRSSNYVRHCIITPIDKCPGGPLSSLLLPSYLLFLPKNSLSSGLTLARSTVAPLKKLTIKYIIGLSQIRVNLPNSFRSLCDVRKTKVTICRVLMQECREQNIMQSGWTFCNRHTTLRVTRVNCDVSLQLHNLRLIQTRNGVNGYSDGAGRSMCGRIAFQTLQCMRESKTFCNDEYMNTFKLNQSTI